MFRLGYLVRAWDAAQDCRHGLSMCSGAAAHAYEQAQMSLAWLPCLSKRGHKTHVRMAEAWRSQMPLGTAVGSCWTVHRMEGGLGCSGQPTQTETRKESGKKGGGVVGEYILSSMFPCRVVPDHLQDGPSCKKDLRPQGFFALLTSACVRRGCSDNMHAGMSEK